MNRQFRDLLLHFRPELSEEDIPRRSKIRTSIVESWARWFSDLREELKVCVIL